MTLPLTTLLDQIRLPLSVQPYEYSPETILLAPLILDTKPDIGKNLQAIMQATAVYLGKPL
jgi:hypothetical protein